MLRRLLTPIIAVLLAIDALGGNSIDSLLMTLGDDVSGIDVHILSESPQFSLTWRDSAGTVAGIDVQRQNNMYDDKDMANSATFTLFTMNNSEKTDLAQAQVHYDGDWCGLRIKKSSGVCGVYGGRNTTLFGDVPLPLTLNNGTTFNVSAPVKDKIKIIRCESKQYQSLGKAPFADIKQLQEYLSNSTDSLEGCWRYLDYGTENNGVKIANTYNLATVKTGDRYVIINLDTNNLWKPMMVRGYLYPTPFIEHFDLEWIDSKRNNVFKRDASATLSENQAILTLSFPVLGAQLRLRRQ